MCFVAFTRCCTSCVLSLLYADLHHVFLFFHAAGHHSPSNFSLIQNKEIQYSPSRDFKNRGDLGSYLKTHWRKCKDDDSTFATSLTKVTWTDEMDQMVRTAVLDGRMDITTLWGMQLLLCYQVLKYFMCCGIKEVTKLKWTRFSYSTYDIKGQLYGRPMAQLHHDTDKTHQISISKPTVRCGKHCLIYVHNKKDLQSFYTKMLKYRAMCPPGEQVRFFCHGNIKGMQL